MYIHMHYIHIYIYSEVMKIIQCAYPPYTVMALWPHASYEKPVAELRTS